MSLRILSPWRRTGELNTRGLPVPTIADAEPYSEFELALASVEVFMVAQWNLGGTKDPTNVQYETMTLERMYGMTGLRRRTLFGGRRMPVQRSTHTVESLIESLEINVDIKAVIQKIKQTDPIYLNAVLASIGFDDAQIKQLFDDYANNTLAMIKTVIGETFGTDTALPKKGSYNPFDGVVRALETVIPMLFDKTKPYVAIINIIQRYFNETIAATPAGIEREWFYVNNVYNIQGFLESLFYEHNIGIEYVQYLIERTDRILHAFPVWPDTFTWNGIQVIEPTSANMLPWRIDLIGRIDKFKETNMFVHLHDMLPCYRGTIASLIASLDANVYFRSVDTSSPEYVLYDAYVMVLIIQNVNVSGTVPRDSSRFDDRSGSVYYITIHAENARYNPNTSRFTRTYWIFNSRTMDIVKLNAETASPFSVDHYIFEHIIPTMDTHIGVPIMQYRIYRMALDREELIDRLKTVYRTTPAQLDNNSRNLDVYGNGYNQSYLVSQRDVLSRPIDGVIINAGLACTFFSMQFAFYRLDGVEFENLDIQHDSVFAQKYITEILTNYKTQCDISNATKPIHQRYRMQGLRDNYPPLQRLDAKRMQSIVNYRRFIYKFTDRLHPYLIDIDDEIPQHVFPEIRAVLMDVWESLNGIVLQDLWRRCYSPQFITYNERSQCYETQSFALCLTYSGTHTVSLVVLGAKYSMINPNDSHGFTFLFYDSLTGYIDKFTDILQLEHSMVTNHQGSASLNATTYKQLRASVLDVIKSGGIDTAVPHVDSTYYILSPSASSYYTASNHYYKRARFINTGLDVGDTITSIVPDDITPKRGMVFKTTSNTVTVYEAHMRRITALTRKPELSSLDVPIPAAISTGILLNRDGLLNQQHVKSDVILVQQPLLFTEEDYDDAIVTV